MCTSSSSSSSSSTRIWRLVLFFILFIPSSSVQSTCVSALYANPNSFTKGRAKGNGTGQIFKYGDTGTQAILVRCRHDEIWSLSKVTFARGATYCMTLRMVVFRFSGNYSIMGAYDTLQVMDILGRAGVWEQVWLQEGCRKLLSNASLRTTQGPTDSWVQKSLSLRLGICVHAFQILLAVVIDRRCGYLAHSATEKLELYWLHGEFV